MEESSHKNLRDLSLKAETLYSLYPFEKWHHRTMEELSSARQENHQVVVSCSGGADYTLITLTQRGLAPVRGPEAEVKERVTEEEGGMR